MLTYNGAAWVPATASSGGVTDHGALSGLADDDHPQYLLADAVRNSTNGFAVTGVFGSGAIPNVSASGATMMWYPRKAAFRAGWVNGGQWDDLKIGVFSTALGGNTIAAGEGAFAAGYFANAASPYATAIGYNATAGLNAVAIASYTDASGTGSVAIGYLASTNNKFGAIVFGDLSTSGSFGVFNAQVDSEFAVRAAGGFRFRTASDLSTGCNLPAGSGVWSCTSSRLRKDNFAPIDADSTLAKIAQLPIQSWSYRTEKGVKHSGLTAEDFHAAFGLGPDSLSIGTIDANGVSLLAIQALEARTAQLKRENAELRAALARLEALVQELRGSR